MKGNKHKSNQYKRSVFQNMTMITQFGINIIVPVFLCFFVGRFLDRRFGTQCLTIILFFVGALAGFRNIYRYAQKIMKDEPSDALKSRIIPDDKDKCTAVSENEDEKSMKECDRGNTQKGNQTL